MMQSRRDIVTIIIFIATCSIFMITVCNGGELSESESESKSFFNFSQSIDPKNVLRIDWNGFVPHPCSHQGVKCNFHGTTIRAIRLENLNLSGKIDTDSLCKLPNLQVLSLAQNHIQGNLPESISNCTTLKYLNLSNNLLNGSVPVGLSKLKSLKRLDISSNHFIEHLNYNASATLSLRFLNAFPPQFADQEAYPPVNIVSSTIDSKNQSAFVNWITWIPLVLCIGFYFMFIFFVNMKAIKLAKEKEILRSLAQSPAKTPPPPPPPPANDVEEVKPDERQSELVFFVGEEERFKMEDLLEAEADLQSQGLCSSLYKVKLKNNAVFAVKRLKKLQVSFEDFGKTMSRIGNLGHPNILPLVGYNSTNEEKLLIYRYQSNGSLLTLQDNYAEGKRDFPWKLRISIAVGIAKGLNFIYHRSNDEEIIPHGNIKPSNILLNENEEPLISEYGFSKFLDPMRASLFNSNGYTAPEKSPSEQADVFSFGVILLEFLTGKTVEKSGLDLPRWVKSMVREEWTGEVFDKELTNVGMYAFPLLNVSLKCVAHFPENRPSIAEVLEKIEEVVHAQEDVSPSPISSVASSQQD